uniref:Uncharacterized protein n=1 Tax=Sphaerodactylus townsendi TaxID=933632 RepID=A0ACB8FWU8_9SAUR
MKFDTSSERQPPDSVPLHCCSKPSVRMVLLNACFVLDRASFHITSEDDCDCFNDSSQENTTPGTLYANIPDSELYDSLVRETTPSSNTCQPFLPLDVNSILKPNSFDIGKTDEREGIMNSDIIDELMSSDVFPLLQLSPAPGNDYTFNLDDNEGVCDLFDVQILNY